MLILLFLHFDVMRLYVLFLFLTMPWVGLQSMIVAFPGHTHLRFGDLSLYDLYLG